MAVPGKKDLDQDYAAAGFGKKLGWGNSPVLLVIDFLEAYLRPDSPMYAGVEDELEVTERILKAAREAGLPIIYTRIEYAPDGRDGGHFFRKIEGLKHLVKGNPLAEISGRIRPEKGDLIVTKQYASSFFGTSLASTLASSRIDTVVMVGLTTSGCVRATALDALQHGFIPIVVADACGDRDQRIQEANLLDLRAKYADVLDSAEVIDKFRELAAG